MKIKLGLTAIVLAGALIWSGCSMLPSPGEVIQPPKQAGAQEEKDLELNNYVQKLLPAGAKLAVPAYPAGAKAIQKADVDGDGKEEVVVTYSIGSNPAQLKVSVFKEDKEVWTYDGQGYGLDCFSITDLTGDKKPELLLGWTVGASAGNGLDIFTWDHNTLKRVTGIGYHKLEIEDMPGPNGTDGKAEIALWQKDTGQAYVIEVLRWQDNDLALAEDVYPYYFKRVVEYYGHRVKEMPDAAFYWYYLADAQVKSNLPAEAMKSIETGVALKLDYPKDYQWHIVKGAAFNKLGKYQEAITELQKGITSLEASNIAFERTHLSQAYLEMARSYQGMKEYDKSEKAAEKAKEITQSTLVKDTAQPQLRSLPGN